jgi:AAA domain
MASARWVMDGLLPLPGLSVIAGRPKIGKSTAARDLALSVALGTRWLGGSTIGALVWYISLMEEPKEAIQRHFRRIGANGAERIDVFARASPDPLRDLQRSLAEREPPVLIIINTLQRFLRADLGGYAATIRLFDPIIQLARDCDTHLLFCHHARKHGRGADAVLGSTGIPASVDTVISLDQHDEIHTISGTQRSGLAFPATVLRLNDDAGRLELGESRDEYDVRLVVRDLVAALAAEAPLPEEAPLKHVEGRTGSKRQALRLARRGTACSCAPARGRGVRHSCTPRPRHAKTETRIRARSNRSCRADIRQPVEPGNARSQNQCSRCYGPGTSDRRPARQVAPSERNHLARRRVVRAEPGNRFSTAAWWCGTENLCCGISTRTGCGGTSSIRRCGPSGFLCSPAPRERTCFGTASRPSCIRRLAA